MNQRLLSLCFATALLTACDPAYRITRETEPLQFKGDVSCFKSALMSVPEAHGLTDTTDRENKFAEQYGRSIGENRYFGYDVDGIGIPVRLNIKDGVVTKFGQGFSQIGNHDYDAKTEEKLIAVMRKVEVAVATKCKIPDFSASMNQECIHAACESSPKK